MSNIASSNINVVEKNYSTSDFSTLYIDFNKLEDLSHTCPKHLKYFEQRIDSFKSWQLLYVAVMQHLFSDYPDIIRGLKGKCLCEEGRIEVCGFDSYLNFKTAKKITDDLYFEIGMDALNIVKRIPYLLDLCHINYENVEIAYSKSLDMSRRIENSYPFFCWLIDKQKLSENTSHNYVSAINSTERFIKKHDINIENLFRISNLQKLEIAIKTLLQDDRFIKYDIHLYKRFIAASKKYLKYVKENPECFSFIICDTPVNESSNQTAEQDASNNLVKTQIIETNVVQNSHEIEMPKSFSDNLLNDEEKKKIKSIFINKFNSGYRLSSNIDYERFLAYYVSEYDENFNASMDKLNSHLFSIAVIFDGRAYLYDDDIIKTIRVYLEQMDSPIIYMDMFIKKHSEKLYEFGVFSSDILKAFIKKNYSDIFSRWDYIYLQPNASTASLVRDVFNEREIWSFNELFEKLPYIKQDTIRQILNRDEYLRINTGIYTHIDNIDLPDSEGERILALVEKRLQTRDYVTANELDLSKIEKYNPDLPFIAIRDAVFHKFLSNNYSKSGQVITRKGEQLRALDVIEQYCRETETASFDELNEFESTFDPEGRTHSLCLVAANNIMVRVSNELFVSNSKVNFDINSIDEIIALYCKNDFIPLKSVTDFSLFPYAGYSWNLFLLESYLRKYSRIFKYDVRAVNSANIGVIVRKLFVYGEYDDILAIALAKSSVPLSDKKLIGDYLFNYGYIGWRNLGKSEEKIITKAKKLREGGAF